MCPLRFEKLQNPRMVARYTIALLIKQTPDYSIYKLNNLEFILSEAQLSIGLPCGDFAIFQSEDGTYKLRAIVDFE